MTPPHASFEGTRSVSADAPGHGPQQRSSSVTSTPLPPVVSEKEWRQAHAALLAKEKELTHARDALAAARRRLPMTKIEKSYIFDETGGAKPSLLDLFEGRQQLLLYHFMFAQGVHGWPAAGCPGCSMFLDNIGQFTPVHLAARGISLAVVSPAPLANIDAHRTRISWPLRWVSSANTSSTVDFGSPPP